MDNRMDNTENREIESLEQPHDLEAERFVLGAMMLDQDAIMDVIDKLRPDDFYSREHEEIYKAFIDMYRRGIRIDQMTTRAQLEKNHTLELVGGSTYLAQLCSDAIVPGNATYYADVVISKSRMRLLIYEAERMRKSAYDGREDAEVILDRAEQGIFNIANRTQRRSYTDLRDVLQMNIQHIQELQANPDPLPGMTSGFRDLDRILTGFHKTDLVVLAARPGMGKTAFALNVAMNAATAGNSVMIFSMEMSKEQLGERMLSMRSNVEMEHIKTGDIQDDEWMSISNAQDAFDEMNIQIDETPDISVLEMKNKCRRLKAERGLDLVIIDYLQLMSYSGKGADTRNNEISALTRSIKIMAKELDICVILLSQLSRNTENRAESRPHLSDLRDSGAIEQDADIVIFLRREEYYESPDDPAAASGMGSTCEVTIAKHRSGPTGIVRLAWIGRYTKFGNLEYTN